MTDFRNISIRTKLVIIQVATAFIAVLICCAIFVFHNVKLFKETSIANKNSIAEIVGINAASTLEFMDHDAATDMLSKLKSTPSILNAVILDKEGKEFARYDKAGEGAYSFASSTGATKDKKNWRRTFLVDYKIGGKDALGTVILRSELTGFKEMLISYLKIALLILLTSLAVAVIISTILQRSITGRLLSLVATTKKVAETNDYTIRDTSDGDDEISGLSGSFNNMLDQIQKVKTDLDNTNNELEERVSNRTAQLEAANKELESFSYSVSHDLRAPVRAINGFARILREDYIDKLDDESKRLTDTILRNAQKMGQLIDDLLAFSHLGRQDLIKRNFSMDDMVRNMCEEMRNEQEAAKVTEFRIATLPPIYGDSVTMKQVWTNLISNAVKYSKLKEHPMVEIGAEVKDNEIIYYVKDNGDGFDMQYVNKLFGVFQRLHSDGRFEGTGVGLAIVHRIITKHGGRVWAEGEVGKGATFYFSLSKS